MEEDELLEIVNNAVEFDDTEPRSWLVETLRRIPSMRACGVYPLKIFLVGRGAVGTPGISESLAPGDDGRCNVIVLDRHDLEERAKNHRECALEVIAHEIAHLYLGHCRLSESEKDAPDLDVEASAKIVAWGFKLCGDPKFYKG